MKVLFKISLIAPIFFVLIVFLQVFILFYEFVFGESISLKIPKDYGGKIKNIIFKRWASNILQSEYNHSLTLELINGKKINYQIAPDTGGNKIHEINIIAVGEKNKRFVQIGYSAWIDLESGQLNGLSEYRKFEKQIVSVHYLGKIDGMSRIFLHFIPYNLDNSDTVNYYDLQSNIINKLIINYSKSKKKVIEVKERRTDKRNNNYRFGLVKNTISKGLNDNFISFEFSDNMKRLVIDGKKYKVQLNKRLISEALDNLCYFKDIDSVIELWPE